MKTNHFLSYIKILKIPFFFVFVGSIKNYFLLNCIAQYQGWWVLGGQFNSKFDTPLLYRIAATALNRGTNVSRHWIPKYFFIMIKLRKNQFLFQGNSQSGSLDPLFRSVSGPHWHHLSFEGFQQLKQTDLFISSGISFFFGVAKNVLDDLAHEYRRISL